MGRGGGDSGIAVGTTATSNLNSIGTAATTSMLTYVHAGRMLEADPIRITKSLAGGAQETDRGEGFYNASATGSIGGGGSARKPVPELQKPAGEWNTWRITAEGSKFMLHCNGKPAWSCTDHVPRRGYIGFRVFKGPLKLRNCGCMRSVAAA